MSSGCATVWAISARTISRNRYDITDACQAVGVPAGPMLTSPDLLENEHFKQRGFLVEIDQPDTPGVVHPGVPFTFSALPVSKPGPAARIGADTSRYLTNGWGPR